MRLLPFVLLLCAGCALGMIRQGELYGVAIGHATIEQCGPEPTETPACIVCPAAPPVVCRRIEGGSLGSTFVEFLTTAAVAALTYFGAM